MARRRRRAKGPRKVPIRYQTADQRVDYVPRRPAELPVELDRVRTGILRALRVLNRMKRIRHSAIVGARFQLEQALCDVPAGASEEWMADEIGRLSFVMADSLKLLSQLCHSRTHWLEEARFILTYGQTPKKREPAGSYGLGTENAGP